MACQIGRAVRGDEVQRQRLLVGISTPRTLINGTIGRGVSLHACFVLYQPCDNRVTRRLLLDGRP